MTNENTQLIILLGALALFILLFIYARSNKASLGRTLRHLIQTYTLAELFKGLTVTWRYFLRRKVTIQCPEEQTPISPRFRGMLALRRYPNGEERCIGCKLCEAVCPALAISIDTQEREDGSRRTTKYEIDAFKCINCGFCEESCPVDSIVVVPEMDYHMSERGENIFTKEKLLAIGDHYEAKLAEDREADEPYR
jgi:NADH-quinone oxidoreductase subunit I